jgi:hypothetical protein
MLRAKARIAALKTDLRLPAATISPIASGAKMRNVTKASHQRA